MMPRHTSVEALQSISSVNTFAAISDYDKAIQLKPDDADAYNDRGNAKSALGQHFAAISDYDKAIQLKPDDAHAYYARGVCKE